ncbi:MAG: HutD family protein [Oscillospiraceae bacterium]|nr:HutD family protein [Oscillospiraceae bacterium]
MRTLIKGSERKVSLWAGGSSSQICIYPADAEYAKRNFLFRISTAVADSDEWSDYTALPAVTRHLLMLDGSALVKHEGQYELLMQPYEDIDIFDGGWMSKAKGKVRDFNLMCREGCQGKVTVLSKNGELPVETASHRLLFCSEGEAYLLVAGERIHLQKEDALYLEPAEAVQLVLGEQAKVICCDMIVK